MLNFPNIVINLCYVAISPTEFSLNLLDYYKLSEATIQNIKKATSSIEYLEILSIATLVIDSLTSRKSTSLRGFLLIEILFNIYDTFYYLLLIII